MTEEQQLPEWLADLDRQQPEEGFSLEEGPKEEAVEHLIEPMQDQTAQPDMVEDLWEQATQPDMVEDLREQMILSEDDFDDEERPSSGGLLPGVKPWQGFVLAVLLLVDVAVLGCLVLLVTGRVMLPF